MHAVDKNYVGDGIEGKSALEGKRRRGLNVMKVCFKDTGCGRVRKCGLHLSIAVVAW